MRTLDGRSPGTPPRSPPRRHRRDIGTDDARHVPHDGDPETDGEPPASAWARLGWFALLYGAGIVVVGAVAWVLRLMISPG